MSGAWKISFSLYSYLGSHAANYAFLYLNGTQLEETRHDTYNQVGQVVTTGGRSLILEVSAGDNITLGTSDMYGVYFRIHFCADYISMV